MSNGNAGPTRQGSLMVEYSSVLAEAVLRQRAWAAESRARTETQLASKIKSEFIANMSHELRTPLNAVIGFAKLLGGHERRRLKDEEIVEYADLIRDAATHLLAVLNDILDISKMQSGKYMLDARDVELDEILQVAVASLRPAALAADIELTTRIEPCLPPVKGDPAKLRQVFGNLIDNALRFTPPGGTVSVAAGAVAGGGVMIGVRDTGRGMSEEEIAIALTPFAQVDAGSSRFHEGAGLGLPIAKALVQLHGGLLEIESAPSQGTQVTVTLPSRPQLAPAHGRATPPAKAFTHHEWESHAT